MKSNPHKSHFSLAQQRARKAGVLEHKGKLKRKAGRHTAGPRGRGLPNPQTKLSQATLAHLRTQFEKLDGVNVANHRAAIDKEFAGMTRSTLKQLASAGIQWISPAAKNALVARRNPAKKNLHPLEIGANSAMILGGLDHLWQMMSRGTKEKVKGQKSKVSKKKNCSSSGKRAAVKSSKSSVTRRTTKANGPIRLSQADIAKLPSHVREKLGISEPGEKGKGERGTEERLFKVTWYSPRLQRRVGPPSFFAASNKTAAIDEVKASIGYHDLKRRKSPYLPVNFMAKEVKRNPKALKNLGLISLVENLQAAQFLSSLGSKLSKKKKKKNNAVSGQRSAVSKKANPNTPALQKIHQDFLGRENSGKVLKLYTPPGPKDVGAMAKLTLIKLADGKELRFRSGDAWIGGVQNGRSRRIHIGLKQPFPMPNGLDPNQPHDYGEVKLIEYRARKPHLYGENSPEYPFYHKLGDEDGRRPRLILHHGCLALRGGGYDIKREGIRN